MQSSLPQENGSLLNDKGGVQDAALQHDLGNFRFSASGGAYASSFLPDDLRQQDKNTAALGTALPAKGAKRRKNKKKKPSAESASHNQLVERSFEQQGQELAATHLRTTWEKTSLTNEIELAASQPKDSLGNIELQEISLRILLILSLRNKWQITTIRATACSEEALGKHLRNIGLEQNKMDPNIFSGDELVIMLHESTILIGGADHQQECFFCELSALTSLENPTKLAQDTQVSFCNKTLEYNEARNNISLCVPTSFYMQLLQRHNLEEVESRTSLQEHDSQEDELSQDASKQNNTALDADRQKLFKQTVGDLVWASCTRPDLSFEVHLLTQSLESPTTRQEEQLHRVLSYIKGTLHYTLSLQPTSKMAKKEAEPPELLAFSATSWTEAFRPSKHSLLDVVGSSFDSFLQHKLCRQPSRCRAWIGETCFRPSLSHPKLAATS